MATRVQAATLTPIFQTVNPKNEEVLRTSGTFIIGLPSKGGVISVIYKGNIIDGEGFYEGAILPESVLYIYPTGYFGTHTRLEEGTLRIGLYPPLEEMNQIKSRQIEYVNSKINAGK